MQDFNLIKCKYDKDMEYIDIYPIGDLHEGSEEMDEEAYLRWAKDIKGNPNGVAVVVGDMIENGLKGSKTNSYDAKMRPREQKANIVRRMREIKDKIIGAVQGNHEFRSSYLTDDCPLYDALSKLDLEECYRDNMCFLKVSLGEKNKDRQFSYTIVLAHGGSEAKTDKFGYAIDGMDVFITGHTHSPKSTFPAKIVIDSKNETVSMKGYTHIVVPSFQRLGGYALKGMYLPQDGSKYPIIRVSGIKKEVTVRWV
jgi:predicted phosphodiesterase